MHPFSVLTLGIFVAGYITARWDLVTRLYELAIFAWEYEVVVRFRNLRKLALGYGDEEVVPGANNFELNRHAQLAASLH